MAKIVTEKSQIPKRYQKQIKNFNKLTPNQAIYEYELIKLQRRAGKEFGNFLKGYYQRPKTVRQKDIEEIRQFRGIKLKKAKQGIAPKKIDYNYPVKPQKTYESPEQYLKETGQRVDPNTGEIVPYESPEEYLKGTNQTVDPNTGEIVDRDEFIANQMELILEFFDELKQSVRNSASNAIISNSSYKNGRERNSRSRQWIADNISKAEDKLIDLIDTIQSDEDRSISVYERFASNDGAFADLQDAISEYLAGSYSSPITQSNTDMNYQRVYTMLSGSPMSLEEAEDFEI